MSSRSRRWLPSARTIAVTTICSAIAALVAVVPDAVANGMSMRQWATVPAFVVVLAGANAYGVHRQNRLLDQEDARRPRRRPAPTLR